MHETPSISFNLLWMNLLLSSNALTICLTLSWGPFNASSAAICAMLVGLLVEWLCKLSIAFITSLLPAEYPMRQPVIAYVFETEFEVIVRFFISSFNDAMLKCSLPP